MNHTTQTHTYAVRQAKWGIHFLDKPLQLTLTPDSIELARHGHTVFKANYTDLASADFNGGNGFWTCVAGSGQKVTFQTHGAFSFANWKLRTTDVNERLNTYLDTHKVPNNLGYPHRFIIRKTTSPITRLVDWLRPRKS